MTATATRRVAVRSVALPAEHGGWGFLLEPLVVGLIAAPAWAALPLSGALFAFFLVHQPVKIALKDLLKKRRTPRSVLAAKFALAYAGTGVALLAVTVVLAEGEFLLVLALALPLLGVQIIFDALNKSRHWIAEMSGAAALGVSAAALAMVGGWGPAAALPLWLLMQARTLPSILYVRARLRLERDKPISPVPAWGAHGIAFVALGTAAAMGNLGWLAVPAAGILLARCVWGLSAWRTPAARPAVIGVQEMGHGLVFAVLAGLAV